VEALVVSDLCAGYGNQWVVWDVGLHAGDGEIVALLGRNGAGKTTTLRAMAGTLSRTAGSVAVDGRILHGPAHRRTRTDIGLVLEGRSVFPGLTTHQNLQVAGVDPAEAVVLFPELASKLRIRAGQLSGGEQQMVSLARAICRRPRVLLIDELSFGLTPSVCLRLFERLAEAARSTRMAVVLVEQHLSYAAELAARAYIMSDGRVVGELPAAELMSRQSEIEEIYFGHSPAHHDGGARR
jgi:branched-chain amino acid transport system ATP-binding protein